MRRLALILALLCSAGAIAQEPAARLLDSAQAWEKQGRPDLARLALEKLLAAYPGHPEASLQLGELEIRSGQLEAVERVLAVLRQNHPEHPATRELAETLRVQTRDRLQLATMRRLYETSRFAEAADAARRLYPDGPPPGPLGVEYTRIVKRAPTLAATQSAKSPSSSGGGHRPAKSAKSPQDSLKLSRDWEAVARRRAEALEAEAEIAHAAGRKGEALRKREEAQALVPADPWARYRLARAYVEAGLPDEARALSAEGVTREPDDADARYAQALLLSSLDDRAGALSALSAIPEKQRSASMNQLEQRLNFSTALARVRDAQQAGDLELARAAMTQVREHAGSNTERLADAVTAWLELGEIAQAKSLADELRAQAPDSMDTQVADARIARAEGRHNLAMQHWQRARALELAADHQGYSAARNGIESLESRRNGWLALAPSYYDKSGDEGISAYRAESMTLEWRQPYLYEDHFFAVADVVRAESGTLPADFEAAQRYGSILAAGPESVTTFGGVTQDAEGVALGLGWQAERLRLDLGSTPLGFPVENWVGGLRWSDSLGSWDYSLNLARRPITGSLLSYAGARDPVSGRIWGGVVSTGLDGRLARDIGALALSVSAGTHRYTGENVPDNDHQTLRLAADWDLIRRDHQQLEAGIALSGWRFAENLGEYSFGHGGYYSPQRYLSASVPFEWSGRWSQLAWLLRGAVSVSRTQTDRQALYPGDAELQAAAEAAAGAEAFYNGGDGGGSGVSLRGALEYRLTSHWYAGGGFELERSEFYTPNYYHLWLRYDFADRAQAMDFPPRAPRPYSSY